jgi:hypothetical protein
VFRHKVHLTDAEAKERVRTESNGSNCCERYMIGSFLFLMFCRNNKVAKSD